MLNTANALSSWDRLWRKKNVVYCSLAWAALSLVFYLFLSGPMQGLERPLWYRISTYIFQNFALLAAGLLCIRNGLSKRMPSGKQVWLLIGLALFAFLIGNVFFSLWELTWNLDPVGSLGDPFFLIFYVFLSLGMLIAIVTKRMYLKAYQWLIVTGVAAYAAFLAMWILTPPLSNAANPTDNVNSAAVATAENKSSSSTNSATAPSLTTTAPVEEAKSTAPDWVMFFDNLLKPYGKSLSVFYVWCDVFLFCLAAVMTIAFWGGRLSNAWQLNAQAITCFYIADMWLAYASNHIEGYQSGFMLEVFWIFGTLLFGIAAAIEFEYMLAQKKLNVPNN